MASVVLPFEQPIVDLLERLEQVKSLADMGAPAKKTLPRDLVEAAGAETDEAGETSGTAASDEEAHD